LECTELLLKYGADVNRVAGFDKDEAEQLTHYAARFTAWMIAEVMEDAAIMDLLRTYGADPSLALRLGLDERDYARLRRDDFCPVWRLERKAMQVLSSRGSLAAFVAAAEMLPTLSDHLLKTACVYGRADALRYLIDREIMRASPSDFYSRLHELAKGGEEIVALLLTHGYRRESDDYMDTVPMELCQIGDTQLLRKALEAGYELPTQVRKPEYSGLEEMTPLMEAIRTGATDCVRVLLDHGAGVNLGIRRPLGKPEDFEMLIRQQWQPPSELKGAPEYYITPLMLAEALENQSAINLLKERGAEGGFLNLVEEEDPLS
jgi:ankyrin repeat protein